MDQPPKLVLATATTNTSSVKDVLLRSKVHQILGIDFEYVLELGGGTGGEVLLCKYKGNDPNTKKLCNVENFIAVKFPAESMDIQQECNIAQFLNSKHTENVVSDLNIGLPFIKNERCEALLLQYVSFNHNLSPPLSASIVSFLQDFYKNVVVKNLSRNSSTDFITKACCTDIGIIFAQLVNEMQRCQFKLHNLRLLHLDTAPRNFLLQTPHIDEMGNFLRFPLVLCDYGHTAQMSINESVDVSQVPRKPSTSRDFRAVNNNLATIQTDIFSLKCSCIGMISVAIANLKLVCNR